jgi:hypothetical protein
MDPCNDGEDTPALGGPCIITLFMDLFFGSVDTDDIYARESERLAADFATKK